MAVWQVNDVVEKSDLIYRDGSWSARRIFRLRHSGSGNPAAELFQAYDSNAVPRPGDPHPAIDGITVQSIDVRPLNGESRIFEFIYEYGAASNTAADNLSLSDLDEISWSVVYVEDKVINDVNGDRLEVVYRGDIPSLGTGIQLESQRKTVTVQRPTMQVAITQTTASTIFELNNTYAGTVNINKWGPFQARAARCEGFTGEQSPTSGLARVTGTFLQTPYEHGTWDVLLSTSLVGEIPADATEGNGFEYFRVFKEKNFTEAGFELPQ